jgi:hypothetical protein
MAPPQPALSVAGMPATFPSHQGAVLPLKLWRPQWFDGVALAIGAAAPDLAYTLDGSGLPVWPLSHQQRGLVLWCLPVTLVLAWVVRRAAPIVAAHLPQTLRDYGVLGVTHHRWWVTWSSALIGAESHLILDRIGQARAIEWTLDAIGAAVTVAVIVHIGRKRLMRTWHGPAPERRQRPVRFWGTAAVVCVAGLAAVPFLPGAWLVHTTGTRALAVAGLALVVAATAAEGRPSPSWRTRPAARTR